MCAMEGAHQKSCVIIASTGEKIRVSPYDDMTYGGREVGFGKKPAIAIVDLQLGFTDPQYPLGAQTPGGGRHGTYLQAGQSSA